VDLASMWKELGIVSEGRTVRMNEDAPLAAVRRGITAQPAAQGATSQLYSPASVFAGRTVGANKPPF